MFAPRRHPDIFQADDTSSANSDRAYQFDAIGNRQKTVNGLLAALPTNANYTVNALNQYTAIPSAPSAPTYDSDGNATSYPLPAIAGANATLVWDAENRLIEVKNGTTTIATYQYDYLGRRIKKHLANGTDILYIYDGWNMIADYTIQNSTFKIHHSYTWGMDLSGSMQGAGGVGGLLLTTDYSLLTTGEAYYPTFDGNGNVSEYLDSNGAVVAHYEYDAFGNTTVSTGTKAADFAHRFSTKPLDDETGLYYYGYRFYDPVTGRWPSRDPIGENGGINLYAFVGNDGVDWWDLLGQSKVSCTPGKCCEGGKCLTPSKKICDCLELKVFFREGKGFLNHRKVDHAINNGDVIKQASKSPHAAEAVMFKVRWKTIKGCKCLKNSKKNHNTYVTYQVHDRSKGKWIGMPLINLGAFRPSSRVGVLGTGNGIRWGVEGGPGSNSWSTPEMRLNATHGHWYKIILEGEGSICESVRFGVSGRR